MNTTKVGKEKYINNNGRYRNSNLIGYQTKNRQDSKKTNRPITRSHFNFYIPLSTLEVNEMPFPLPRLLLPT
jgi:hypothetical protein